MQKTFKIVLVIGLILMVWPNLAIAQTKTDETQTKAVTLEKPSIKTAGEAVEPVTETQEADEAVSEKGAEKPLKAEVLDISPVEYTEEQTLEQAVPVLEEAPEKPILEEEQPIVKEEAEAKPPRSLEEAIGQDEVKKPVEPAETDDLAFYTKDGRKWLKFGATLQSVLVYQNDTDFDSTPPAYEKNGQSGGLLGTFLKTKLTLFPIKQIKIHWEMEMGLNLWSRHDPDQYTSGERDTFRIAQRELYAEGMFMDGLLGFKVGYQYFEDPGALFLGHWLGGMTIISKREWADFSFTIAQIPGQTFEGITMDSNNFQHDTFIYGLRVDIPYDVWKFTVGLYGLHDSETVGQSLNLFSPSVSISANYEMIKFGLDVVFQAGTTTNGANMADEETLAWALQAYAKYHNKGFGLEFNQLVLSGDDKYDRNKTNHGFFYSGKSRSRTLILSENEIRDIGGNLDERLAERRGKFYVARPGLSLTDITLSYKVAEYFVPSIIIGAGFVLEKDNALGGEMVGIETDLDLQFTYKDVLDFHLIGGLLYPGKAAAAFVNSYDREETNIQYMLEASISVSF